MTSVIGRTAKPKYQLTDALITFVSTPVGWRVYMGVHCRVREMVYDRVYLSQRFDSSGKEYIRKEIMKTYIPVLEREYTKYEKGETRTVPQSAFSQEVKEDCTTVVMAWLLAEAAEIYKQSRLNIKYSKKKNNNNWL